MCQMEPLHCFRHYHHHHHLHLRVAPTPLRPFHRHCLWIPPILLPHPYLRGASLLARADTQPPEEAETELSSAEATSVTPSATLKNPDAKRAGFGGSAETGPKKKKGKGKERGPVIRRSPIDKSSLAYTARREKQSQAEQEQKLSVSESAFLLTWLGLGALILIEGIALAASGFLPEEWDGFFVKYLYPSFTPTVALFFSGTVAYGVFKYLQAEKTKS